MRESELLPSKGFFHIVPQFYEIKKLGSSKIGTIGKI
jgi:hypothetical protein